MPQTVTSRAVSALVSAVVGAVVAAVGTAVHQLVVGAQRWPAGLAAALALTTLWGLLLGRRPGPAVARTAGVLGWAVVVLLVSTPRPEGDVLVPGNGRGYAWMFAGLVLLVATVVLPARRGAQGRG